jgi:hypothetical protein
MTPAAHLIALLGLVLAILGLGSALDVVSLRVLLAGAELWGAVGPVQALRATLEQRGAQGLEVACGLPAWARRSAPCAGSEAGARFADGTGKSACRGGGPLRIGAALGRPSPRA